MPPFAQLSASGFLSVSVFGDLPSPSRSVSPAASRVLTSPARPHLWSFFSQKNTPSPQLCICPDALPFSIPSTSDFLCSVSFSWTRPSIDPRSLWPSPHLGSSREENGGKLNVHIGIASAGFLAENVRNGLFLAEAVWDRAKGIEGVTSPPGEPRFLVIKDARVHDAEPVLRRHRRHLHWLRQDHGHP